MLSYFEFALPPSTVALTLVQVLVPVEKQAVHISQGRMPDLAAGLWRHLKCHCSIWRGTVVYICADLQEYNAMHYSRAVNLHHGRVLLTITDAINFKNKDVNRGCIRKGNISMSYK